MGQNWTREEELIRGNIQRIPGIFRNFLNVWLGVTSWVVSLDCGSSRVPVDPPPHSAPQCLFVWNYGIILVGKDH